MNAQIAYNEQGEITSITMFDADSGQNFAVNPQEGGFVLEVDLSTMAETLAHHTDRETMLAIMNAYRVDRANNQLVGKDGN